MDHSQATGLAVPYDNAGQQREAAILGMWIFLATEVLFFGGLFVAYAAYRMEYPAAFAAGSRHLSVPLGALMTAVLLLGSLYVAQSDLLIHEGNHRRRAIVRRLTITTILGIVFLGMEFYEYRLMFQEHLFPGRGFAFSAFSDLPVTRSVQIFFCLFFFSTGLHAFHMIIGVLLVAGMAVTVHRAEDISRHRTLLENIGLYWHFVDVVWIFLFPLYYLIEA